MDWTLLRRACRAAAVRNGRYAGMSGRASRLALASLLGLLIAPQVHAQSCGIGETPVAFGFTGGEQTVVVPAGVQSATVYLSGGQGGAGRSGAGTIGGSPNSPGGTGGLGGRVRGTLAVTPGVTLSIWVGGQGSQAVNPGGVGQGTDGIGGGATDLRVGGNALVNRVAVAGGGGGGGNAGWSSTNVIAGGNGGGGGGGLGAKGADVPGGPGPFGGGGGAVGTGGAAGGGCGGFPASAGNAANGDGGDSFNFSGSFTGAGYGGGGGGGATVGAGGGGAGVGTTGCQQNWNGGGGGGAGGSSAASGLTAVVINNGVQAGNGAALICFAASTHSVGGTAVGQTGAVTVQLTATNPASTQQVVVAQGTTTFAFPTPLPQGANWNLSVLSAPAGQICSLNPASGASIAADVTNVVLSCATVAVTLDPATLPDATFSTGYSMTLNATSANGAFAPYAFSVSAGALPAGMSLSGAGVLSGTPNAAGSYTFTVQATSSNGFSGTRAYTLTIHKASQAITAFTATPAAPTYAPNGTFVLSATPGASGNPVVFASSSPAICTVSGATVTMLGVGTCGLTANQAEDANYAAAPEVTLDVTIAAAAQALTNFTATPAAPTYAPNGTFALNANPGASSSPVVFASNSPAICTVSGSTVTMLGAGTCRLTANQAADANYTAAPEVALDVTIAAAAQAITNFIANPTTPTYAPNGTFTLSATAGASSSPVVFASTSPAICSLSGNTVTMLGAGTCALTANQAGDANYTAAPQVVLPVTIGAATPSLTWTGALHKFVGESAFELPAPTSTSPGSFTYTSSNTGVATISGRTVTLVGPGTTTLTATQAATPNYTAGSISLELTVDARPDPTRDPSVVDGLQAQVDASLRFVTTQQRNVQDRLRQLRNAQGTPSQYGLSMAYASRDGQGLSLPVGSSGDAQNAPRDYGVWTAGSIVFGERGARGVGDGFDLRSSGISVGVDRAFGDFVFGTAVGAGWGDTDFNDERASQDASQRSLMLYGLWRGPAHWYADAVLGWGRLDFDLTRWSDTASALATARREGDQQFGALSLGYTQRGERADITGYGRLEASRTTLDAYRETGLGIYDLAYREQQIEGSMLAAGVEGSHRWQWGERAVRPFWSLEYRNALHTTGDAAMNYVLMPVASDYVLRLRSDADNLWSLGTGFDLELTRGWQISLTYRREQGDGLTSDGFGLRLSYGGSAALAPLPPTEASAVSQTGH